MSENSILSSRSNIAPFLVMEMARAANEKVASGVEVLRLEVGQPSTGAPSGAIAAVHDAMDASTLGYTLALGMPSLRQRISDWYRTRYGLNVSPDRIAVTTGASASCVLAFLALFDEGDRVGVLTPGYPCYPNDLKALGVEAVEIPVDFDTGFKPTAELLDQAGDLDGLVLSSPSNPTGTVLFDEDLAELTRWAAKNGVKLIVDEIYHGIGAEAPTALAHSEQTVVFNSFSKYFSMTGWRLGWLVAPAEAMGAIERLAQNLMIAAPTISQVAGEAAFDCCEELDLNVVRYAHNREVVLKGLADAGFDRIAPADGAFYVWVDTSGTGYSSMELCHLWLDELGVAATPGLDFDPDRGGNFVRFSYAGETADMKEAMKRLIKWTDEAGISLANS